MMRVELNSEVGELRGVVLHRPGTEIEQMTPATIKEALYSDILSRQIAQKEYTQLEGVLKKYTQAVYIDDLLLETLVKNDAARPFLLKELFRLEKVEDCRERLENMNLEELVQVMVQGLPGTDLKPLYNLYFTRDIGVCFNHKSLPLQMATQTRRREILLTEVIYRFHPDFTAGDSYVQPWADYPATARLEGGDFLVADENIFLIGQGMRSDMQGVQAVIDIKKKYSSLFYIITQALPEEPESFIHLDMVFTLLSREHCMVYEPLILKGGNQYPTHLIKVENSKVTMERADNILEALKKLGKSYRPILCGGKNRLYQDREQWHSGANFFAFAPGKIMGYGRNSYTVEALDQAGFEVMGAREVMDGKKGVEMGDESKKALITLESSELVRGGGGCRCMTQPIQRLPLH